MGNGCHTAGAGAVRRLADMARSLQHPPSPAQVPGVPITWEGDYAPYSVFGDVKWSDVSVTVQVLLDEPGMLTRLLPMRLQTHRGPRACRLAPMGLCA